MGVALRPGWLHRWSICLVLPSILLLRLLWFPVSQESRGYRLPLPTTPAHCCQLLLLVLWPRPGEHGSRPQPGEHGAMGLRLHTCTHVHTHTHSCVHAHLHLPTLIVQAHNLTHTVYPVIRNWRKKPDMTCVKLSKQQNGTTGMMGLQDIGVSKSTWNSSQF